MLLCRVQELMRLAKRDDPRVTDEIEMQIVRTASLPFRSTQEKLFQASYLLTLLTLYAAAGEAMGDPVMSVLQSDEYSMEALWNAYSLPSEHKTDPVVFLTVHSGLLQDNPLPQHRFFGREEELFDLKELAAANQKCLIAGMGGMGKTELLRQLISRCKAEHTVDKIAVVPYDSGIAESFARSFPGFQRQNSEDSFQMILRLLNRESEQGKLLLLVDDVTRGTDEDPRLSALCSLNCAVFVTSRRSALEGFETFRLKPPMVATGALIFRDNYDRQLSREDQTVLTGILANEVLCHPLTLRLMARAARGRKWSVQELEKQLRQNGLSFSWQEEEREVGMKRLYRQLYSYMQLPEEYHVLAELFALLPRDSYPAQFLCRYFPDAAGPEAELQTRLSAMCQGGWLEADGGGWSMHPLIAQCLRRTVLNEEIAEPFLRKIRQRLLEMGAVDAPEPEGDGFLRLCRIYIHIVGLLGGPVSAGTVWGFANAAAVSEHTDQTLDQYEKLLKKLKKSALIWMTMRRPHTGGPSAAGAGRMRSR